MLTGTVSRAGVVATATVMFFGAAILRGGAATAETSQDDQFLAVLNQRGIPALENAPSLFPVAHEVCGELDGGVPVDQVVESMVAFAYDNNPGMRVYPHDRLTRTFSRFVAAAVQVYCPVHQNMVASLSAFVAPRSIDGGVFVTSHTRSARAQSDTRSAVRAPQVETIPAGVTFDPKPPQLPVPPPPPAHLITPPRAPAPSQAPRHAPPVPQRPPPPQQPPPQPQEPPPPPQQPPPPQEPPPQHVESPVIAPEPETGAGGGVGDGGVGGGGTGGTGGTGGSHGPAEPSPAAPMGPGIIQIAP